MKQNNYNNTNVEHARKKPLNCVKAIFGCSSILDPSCLAQEKNSNLIQNPNFQTMC
jgi:hypothetical protein